jgi:microsomal dipeptidase-like Zn-dependent dipeptidase
VATVDDAAECIDHIVEIAGIDHVGISSDSTESTAFPRASKTYRRCPRSPLPY